MKPVANFARGSSEAWRWTLVVGSSVALLWWLCFRFPVIWAVLGIGEPNRPFLDLYALLAACDGLKLGLNPYGPNPLDPYNRGFGFSSWWFEISRLGLSRRDLLWLGSVQAGALLVATLWGAQPQTRRQALLVTLFLLSPAMLFAVQRANQDAVIFIVMAGGFACLRQPGPARFIGVLLAAVAAVLKFFPLVSLVVLLGFRTRRDFWCGAALYGATLLLAWPSVAPAFAAGFKDAPAPSWLYAFGAPMLARDFELPGRAWTLWPTVVLAVWALVAALRSPDSRDSRAMPDGETAEREFICGAVMIVGVFFLGASYLYKVIFGAWLLPWLWTDAAPEPGWRRGTLILLLTVVWLEGLMAALINLAITPLVSEAFGMSVLKATLIASQLADWLLVACLTRFAMGYLWRRLRFLFATGVPLKKPA